ncbi:MAG: hypothetical protein K1000chlam1_01538 [Candidatus Anoxychlamydiales bacterium]|nr:hypothetical protein [Candidatus Anoxychlamydiales bacterium]
MSIYDQTLRALTTLTNNFSSSAQTRAEAAAAEDVSGVETSGECYIKRIPDEVLLNIFNNLSISDLQSTKRVCRKWYIWSQASYESRFVLLEALNDLTNQLKPFMRKADLDRMLVVNNSIDYWSDIAELPAERIIFAIFIKLSNKGRLHLFVEALKEQNNFQALDIIDMHKMNRFFNPDASDCPSTLTMPPRTLSLGDFDLLRLADKLDTVIKSADLEKMKPQFPSLYVDWEAIMEKGVSQRINEVLQALAKKGDLYLFVEALKNEKNSDALEIIQQNDAAERFTIELSLKPGKTEIDPSITELPSSDQLPFLDELADNLEKSGLDKTMLTDIKAIIQRDTKSYIEDWEAVMEDRFYLREVLRGFHKKKILHHFMTALKELADQHKEAQRAINIIQKHVSAKLFTRREFSVFHEPTGKILKSLLSIESLAYKLKKSGFGKEILRDMMEIDVKIKKYLIGLDDFPRPINRLFHQLYGSNTLHIFRETLEKLKDKHAKCKEAIYIIDMDKDLTNLFSPGS